MIYLDNAATTFPKHEMVYKTMDDANRRLSVNAGRGSYDAAKKASALIEDTRAKLSSLFHASGLASIVFTPSVTHAINQVLRGLDISQETTIYTSCYEHNAVARTVASIQNEKGCTVKFIPVKDDLTIDVEQLEYCFSTKQPDIVIINALSNVTGYILPVKQICELAKEYDAITIVDAAQAAGLIELDLRNLDADVLCFAGHKTLGGPFGIGGFTIKHHVESMIQPIFTGGTGSDSLNMNMPSSAPAMYEASSPNIVAIAGLYAALIYNSVSDHYAIVQKLTNYLKQQIQKIPNIQLFGMTDDCLGIISFAIEGYTAGDVGDILNNEFDIAVRTGYHCAPFIHQYLHDEKYAGTVRVGLGQFNTFSDIDALISALNTL